MLELTYLRRPRSTDECQDRRIVRGAMANGTASMEVIWTHVAPTVSPRINGNSLLAAGLRSSVTLTRLSFKSRHREARLLWCRDIVEWEWNGALLFSVMIVGSICMRVKDVHLYRMVQS